MDCTGCIHKKICELWGKAEGQDASCYDDRCKETLADILGNEYDLDRLRELVETDRDGRCVVLPCKPGKTVYKITVSLCKWRDVDKCHAYCDGYGDCWEGKRIVITVPFEVRMLNDIGKLVFLTREAAEAALKGDQHGQDL